MGAKFLLEIVRKFWKGIVEMVVQHRNTNFIIYIYAHIYYHKWGTHK